ncbi:MAG: phospho-N-acetylmuramoyl-pentapeptide-transferase [Alphaproteobacteria bacterium]|nr:phospho-N-acetylmuramoyl-pentapeptide-transferase [Alphaproteobacteria bacterium]
MLSTLLVDLGFRSAASGWFGFSGATAVAFVFMILFGPAFINAMRAWQKKGQPIRSDGPKTHLAKAGTPTMGGLLILLAIFVSAALFIDFRNPIPFVALLSLVFFGAIGFVDDYGKIKRQASNRAAEILSARARLALGGIGAIILAFLADRFMPSNPDMLLSIYIPFFHILIPAGIFYFVFAYFVIVGSANAANITDGLDGMLSKIMLPVLVVITVALYGATHYGFLAGGVSLPDAAGLYPIVGAVLGAVLGFLWFNAKPAQIFMGDVGSLALGGFIGTVAMQLKAEFVVGLAAAMMVIILLSSFLQTMVFKLTKDSSGRGRRIFKMAPLHHHFELSGLAETKIVERFFIASIIFSAVALVLLKV